MADISHIKGPDNTSYDIKDATARSDISNLATVASTGEYSDLLHPPTVAEIDDTSTAVDKAWSAQKIGNDLAGKANSSHTHTISQVSWPEGQNLTCTATAANKEYSIDLPSNQTGCYFHVWSGKNGKTILKCDNDTNDVAIENGKLIVNGTKGGDWVSSKNVNQASISVNDQATNGQRYDSIIAEKCYNNGVISIGRITNELHIGYVESGQTANSLTKSMCFNPTADKVSFQSNGSEKCKITISTGSFDGKWNGITDDHSTNNTTDTWVPVFTGSTMQHRVIPTDYNNKIIGEDNHAASTGAALSDDTGRIGLHWYSQTGKITNQPTQYGFLLTCATAKGSVEQHSIFMEQANGNLYHMGTNGGSSGSPPAYKKIWDSGNAPYGSVSFTRSHASVSYTEHLSCYRFGNVVMFAGYFSCGASIGGNTALYSGLPKPAGGKHIYFTWSGYDFFLNASDGTIRTNGTIVSRDYVGTFTYICA